MPEVLVVAKLWPTYLQMLREHFVVHDRLHLENPRAFAEAAPRIQAIAGSGESRIPRELIAQLPALQMISIFGVGYDGVDVAAARERAIPVTNTPDVLNDEVADLAMALLLGLARRVAQGDQYVRSGQWAQGPMALGRKVSGARLGIVGLGRIGQAIARRAQAFGMSLAYTARNRNPAAAIEYHPSVEALAAVVDFLVVITPGGEGTRGLIDARVLKALGPEGYLINIARGSVVDEPALIEALEQGLIAGAALDVFYNEPNVAPALRASDKVLLTPHIGSATWQTRRAMADLALGNLLAHFAGRPLLTPLPA